MNRPLLLATLLITAWGCSTKPPTSQELITSWLREAPRTIAVETEEGEGPVYWIHESQAWKGAGTGAYNAAGGLLGSQSITPTLLFSAVEYAAKLVLTPVFAVGGAIHGASSAEPLMHESPIDTVAGAPGLFESQNFGQGLLQSVHDRVTGMEPGPDGHTLRADPVRIAAAGDPGIRRADALLRISLVRYGLAGKKDDGPDVGLRALFAVSISRPERSGEAIPVSTIWEWSRIPYDGSWRQLSEWKANDARLFRQEIDRAAEMIAARIVDAIPSVRRAKPCDDAPLC